VKEISEEEFEEFQENKELTITSNSRFVPLNDSELKELVKKLNVPVDEQKVLAARLKHFIDELIDRETKEEGFLSEATRKWVVTYADLLDRIHKNLYGEKRVNFDLSLSHAHLASLIREHKDKDIIDVASKGVDSND
jgi:hypothetical protein